VRSGWACTTCTALSSPAADACPELPTAHPERGLVAPLLRPGVALTFTCGAGDICTGDFTADWSRTDELRLSDVRAGDLVDRLLWGLKPLQRIE